MSKSPLVRPSLSFEKLKTDLRQVPKEFVKMSNIEYMFISVKKDLTFQNTKRLIKIIEKIFKLEKSSNH